MSDVRASPELLAVARRWFDAVPKRRPNDLRNLMSEGDHLLFIGTADGELWSGQAVRDGVADFFGAVPDFVKQQETYAEAYENGETGWACFTHEIVFATHPDKTFLVRNTLIFSLEEGVWKIVHRHGSLPIPNMEFTGTEQTAIADLVEAAKEGFALDQTEGLASIMFTDIVGSSALASAVGDRGWSDIIGQHFAQLREIIEHHDGQFVKSLGDGAMSSFASAHQALKAATAIQSALRERRQEPRLAVRIGLHTGDVVQSEDDFFGSVVNKAARITSRSGSGEIWVSDATKLMIGETSTFRFSNSKTVMLKGFEDEHLIHRLEDQS